MHGSYMPDVTSLPTHLATRHLWLTKPHSQMETYSPAKHLTCGVCLRCQHLMYAQHVRGGETAKSCQTNQIDMSWSFAIHNILFSWIMHTPKASIRPQIQPKTFPNRNHGRSHAKILFLVSDHKELRQYRPTLARSATPRTAKKIQKTHRTENVLRNKRSPKSLFSTCLYLSGDIETNPGPRSITFIMATRTIFCFGKLCKNFFCTWRLKWAPDMASHQHPTHSPVNCEHVSCRSNPQPPVSQVDTVQDLLMRAGDVHPNPGPQPLDISHTNHTKHWTNVTDRYDLARYKALTEGRVTEPVGLTNSWCARRKFDGIPAEEWTELAEGGMVLASMVSIYVSHLRDKNERHRRHTLLLDCMIFNQEERREEAYHIDAEELAGLGYEQATMLDFNTILIPAFVSGNHYVMVEIDLLKNTITITDSLWSQKNEFPQERLGYLIDHVKTMLRWEHSLQHRIMPKWQHRMDPTAPLQQGVDCGAHVCLNLKIRITLDCGPEGAYHKRDIANARIMMCYELDNDLLVTPVIPTSSSHPPLPARHPGPTQVPDNNQGVRTGSTYVHWSDVASRGYTDDDYIALTTGLTSAPLSYLQNDTARIRTSEIATLRKNGKLNTGIIDQYIGLLRTYWQHQWGNIIVCDTHMIAFPYCYLPQNYSTGSMRFMGSRDTLLEHELIYYPVCVDRNHFIVVQVNTQSKLITFYDSLYIIVHKETLDVVMEILERQHAQASTPWNPSQWTSKVHLKTREQSNVVDCGVFVLANLKVLVTTRGNPEQYFKQQHIDDIRKLICFELQISTFVTPTRLPVMESESVGGQKRSLTTTGPSKPRRLAPSIRRRSTHNTRPFKPAIPPNTTTGGRKRTSSPTFKVASPIHKKSHSYRQTTIMFPPLNKPLSSTNEVHNLSPAVDKAPKKRPHTRSPAHKTAKNRRATPSPLNPQLERQPNLFQPSTQGTSTQVLTPEKTTSAGQHTARQRRALFPEAAAKESTPNVPDPLPSPTSLQEDQAQLPHSTDHSMLTNFMTINARGITTNKVDVLDLIVRCNPDFICITETKLCTQQNGRRFVPKGYRTYCTIKDPLEPQAGLIVAYREHLDLLTEATKVVEDEVKGHLLHLKFQIPQSNDLHVVGVYMPQGMDGRQQVYTTLNKIVSQHPNASIVAMGDWNATLMQSHRRSGTSNPSDELHRSWADGEGWVSATMKLDPHTVTFRAPELSHSGKIDDVFTHGSKAHLLADQSIPYHVSSEGSGLDHDVIGVKLPLYQGNVSVPLPPQVVQQPSRKVLITPIKQEHQEAFINTLSYRHARAIEDLETTTEYIITHDVERHQSQRAELNPDIISKLSTIDGETAVSVVDTLAASVMNILQLAHKLALEMCPTTDTHQHPYHHRPKVMAKERRRIVNKRKEALNVAQQLQQLNQTHVDMSPGLRGDLVDAMKDKNEQFTTLDMENMAATYRQQLKDMDREHASIAAQIHKQKMRVLADKRQKMGNQMITGEAKHKGPGLTVLRDPDTGHPTCEPAKVKQIVEEHFQPLLKPPGGERTGNYHPSDTSRRQWIWESPQSPDPFTIATKANSQHGRHWCTDAINDHSTYTAMVQSLSTGKAPGPDCITNEIIKMLPPTMHKVIHNLFIIMWECGYTPDAWTTSGTILLFKQKNSPLDLSNYRPIGLMNTIYKLWTKFVTAITCDYAEQQGILSMHNAGFRKTCTTSHQVQTLVRSIEDAQLFGQDIYLMLVDFTSAFNMCNHDKMLRLMFDMGFPTDAIETIKGIYKNPTTFFKTPYGDTTALQVERGTIQGDSLSPFMFLLYIEPLLRWLHVGARGYAPGCLQGDDKIKYAPSALGFADDIALLTKTLLDLKIQARKLSEYANAMDMIVNAKKTLATAALHGHKKTPVCGGPFDQNAIRTQLEGKIIVQGHAITYHPPDDPFTYLGIDITMTLNWSPQLAKTLKKLRDKVKALKANTWASTGQKLRVINTKLKPMLKYTFSLAPYNKSGLKALDSSITTAVKAAYKIQQHCPNAMVRASFSQFGMNQPSLEIEYNLIAIQTLREALDDSGRLGVITRSLFEAQLQANHEIEVHNNKALLNSCSALRQWQAARDTGIEICISGTAPYSKPQPPILALGESLTYHTDWDKPLCPIPHTIINLVATAGITSVSEMIDQNSGRLKTVGQIAKCTGIYLRNRHKLAYNKLALLLHYGPEADRTALDHKKVTDLPLDKRELHHIYRDTLPIPQHWGMLSNQRGQRTIHDCMQAWLNDRSINDRQAPEPDKSLGQKIEEVLMAQAPLHEGVNPDPIPTRKKIPRSRIHTPPAPTRISERVLARQATRSTPQKSPPQKKRKVNAKQGNAPQRRKNTKKAFTMRTSKFRAQLKHGNTPTGQRNLVSREAHAQLIISKSRNSTDSNKAEAIRQACNFLQCQRDRVKEIHGRYLTKKPNFKATNRAAVPSHQWLYLVEWEDTYMPEYEVKYHQLNTGYEPTSIRDVDPTIDDMDEVGECLMCEYCSSTEATEGKTLTICSTCERGYHNSCCAPQEAPFLDGDEYICSQCRDSPAPARNKLVWKCVTWPETWEPQEHLAHASDLIEAWKQRMGEEDLALHDRSDAHMSPMDRQGVLPEAWKCSPHSAKGKLHVHLDPIDPHLDTLPTGRPTTYINKVMRMNEKLVLALEELIILHDKHGKATLSMTTSRFKELYNRYLHDTDHELSLDDIHAPLLALCNRYKNGTTHNKHRVQSEHQWATPNVLTLVLHSFLHVTKDRFSSPLVVHPLIEEYWTIFPEDAAFGAHTDSYSTKWTGSSLASPDPTSRDCLKAVRWALHSAVKSEEPTLTTMILPLLVGQSTAYMDMVETFPAHCRKVCTLHADFMMHPGPDSHSTTRPDLIKPKLRYQLVLIGNQQGYDAYAPKTGSGWDDMASELTGNGQDMHAFPYNEWKDKDLLANMAEEAVNLVSSSRHAPPRGWHPSPPDGSTEKPHKHQRLLEFSTPPPLAYKWRELAYTDGSRQDMKDNLTGIKTSVCGAGIYTCREGDPALGTKTTIDPNPGGILSSNNRAELAAIYEAVRQGHTKIATDSMTSMYQLKKGMLRPHKLLKNKHELLVTEILKLIAASQAPIHIYKVKAHHGVVGNVMADQVAKMACERTFEGTPCEHDVKVGKDPFRHRYWLRRCKDDPTDDSDETLPDVDESLKQHCKKHHALGQSNLDSVYYQAWLKTAPMADHKVSNNTIYSSEITRRQRTKVLQYRMGALYTNKLAFRYKHSTSSKCPLCGEEDGGHHAVSFCKVLLDTVTATRHHTAVRLIMKAVLKGKYGANILTADAGNMDLKRQENMDHIRHQLSPSFLALELQPSRPDGVIFTGAKCIGDGAGSTVHLIEVKYCRDTDTTKQEGAAISQHTALKTEIRKAYPSATVTQHNILLGVGGTIYNDFYDTMKMLGVEEKSDLQTLAKKLVIHAIQGIEKAMDFRTAWIRNSNPRNDGQANKYGPWSQPSSNDPHRKRHQKRRHKPP